MSHASRNSNPFATCWTNPQSVDYVADSHCPPALLAERLESMGWRGQIVGPHGVGKSTLLCALREQVDSTGRQWKQVDFHDSRIHEGWLRLKQIPLAKSSLLVVDGFEQLSWFARAQVRWRCERLGAGLLVTAHRPLGLPSLVELVPNQEIASIVFRRLTADTATPVDEADLCNAFNACNGNMRETLFKLYDLHEQRIRQAPVANNHHPTSVNQAVPAAVIALRN